MAPFSIAGLLTSTTMVLACTVQRGWWVQCSDDNLTHASTVPRRVGRDRILSAIETTNGLKRFGKIEVTADGATEAKFVGLTWVGGRGGKEVQAEMPNACVLVPTDMEMAQRVRGVLNAGGTAIKSDRQDIAAWAENMQLINDACKVERFTKTDWADLGCKQSQANIREIITRADWVYMTPNEMVSPTSCIVGVSDANDNVKGMALYVVKIADANTLAPYMLFDSEMSTCIALRS